MPSDNWPDNTDGDVFRRLKTQGFDFSKPYVIDFNVDFDQWPPPERAVAAIKEAFSEVAVHEDEDGGGYLLFKVSGLLSYELVMSTQAMASALVASVGGKCDSWGVLHLPGICSE